MPKQYDPETRAKALRLVRDHIGDYASESDGIRATASAEHVTDHAAGSHKPRGCIKPGTLQLSHQG